MINPDRLVEIFSEAKARPAGFERDQFLDEACRDDPDLREQVESLLLAEDGAGDFLQLPCDARGVAEKVEDVIGRYKLRELIGEGGCGVVYVADQEEPVRRRVALKLIKLGMDTRAVVARFEAERQALAMMDHPNIAKVLDAGATSGGRPYFVMELVRGTRITDYCSRNGLAINERLALFIQVCQAVQHAHQKGIIHRDLKPSNVLVTLHDGVPVPKIIDFGIAKAIEGRLTDSTVYTGLYQFVGTPAYMSPEQAEMSGLNVDTRSDIYSLGVLLYELLTGCTPFDERELLSKGLDVMRRTIRETDPLRPSTKLRMTQGAAHRNAGRSRTRIPEFGIEKDLDWIVMKCLEKDRTRRYQTANDLAADLKRHLQDEPVTARPPSTAYRFHKAFRRNKLAFTTATLIAAALLIGLVTSLWQTREAKRARAAAQWQIYIDSMNLVRQAWKENHVGRVRELLAATATEANRGFEWYYWQRQTHLELATLRGHRGPVSAVAFSPDGARIVTGSFDGNAIVWDANAGKALFWLTGGVGRIQSVAWSPDGLSIALAGIHGEGEVWHASTHRLQFSLIGHRTNLTSVAFSPDGQRLVTASRDGTVRVWDAHDGRELMKPLEHFSPVWTAVFSKDGRRVLTATGDEEAIVWDLASRTHAYRVKAPRSQNPMRQVDGIPDTSPFTAIFSLEERWIITGSQDQTVRLWDTVHSEERPLEFRGNAFRLSPREWNLRFPVALSPDGRQVITGGFDRAATLWPVGAAESLFRLKGHEAEIGAVAFSPDGRLVVTGSFDHTARVWDPTASKESRVFDGHQKTVTSAAFSSNSQWIVTTSWDKSAKVWDLATGRVLHDLRHQEIVWEAALSPDDRRIVTGSKDGTATVWDAVTGAPIFPSFRAHGTNAVARVAFSPKGDRFLTSGEDGAARVWDAFTGRLLLELTNHPRRFVRAAAFSPDGRRIATATEDADPFTNEEGPVFVWDAVSGRLLFPIEGHRGGVSSLAYSPDGRMIISGSMDRTAKVWDAATGRYRATLTGHPNTVIRVGFSPDSSRIITTGFDYTTRLWDSATFQEVLNIEGHLFLAISPDGRLMVSGGALPAQVLEIASEDQIAKWRREEESNLPSGRP